MRGGRIRRIKLYLMSIDVVITTLASGAISSTVNKMRDKWVYYIHYAFIIRIHTFIVIKLLCILEMVNNMDCHLLFS